MKIALITPSVIANPLLMHGAKLRYLQIQNALEHIAGSKLAIWDLHQNRVVHQPSVIRDSVNKIASLAAHFYPYFAAQSLVKRDIILAWIDKVQPTHVVVSHTSATELIRDLRQRGIYIFVDCHNVESLCAKQSFLVTPWSQKLGTLTNWQVFRRWEKRYFPLADEIWLPSEVDVTRQQMICGNMIRAKCVPNAVNISFYKVSMSNSTHKIVFPANFGYMPNVQAAQILSKQILPKINKYIPDARLILAGVDPYGWAQSLQDSPNIIVTGQVLDIRPYLRNAGVVPVPIIQGSGTRFKILEALALGLPVVTTPLGCEGLEVKDEEHLLIRNVEQFAETIVSLLLDPQRGRMLGQNGHNLIQAKYSWQRVEEIISTSLAAAPLS